MVFPDLFSFDNLNQIKIVPAVFMKSFSLEYTEKKNLNKYLVITTNNIKFNII